MSERVKYENPPGACPAQGLYSHVTRVKQGDTLYIAGQLSVALAQHARYLAWVDALRSRLVAALGDCALGCGVLGRDAEHRGGVANVLALREKTAAGIAHARAGDLIAVAKDNAWFTYYYWMEDRRAPDFARCVDIHRKPGYDPVELFLDPKLRSPKLKVAGKLLKKKLGFRMLMDVIPLDPSLVGGSHGLVNSRDHNPIVIGPDAPNDLLMFKDYARRLLLN